MRFWSLLLDCEDPSRCPVVTFRVLRSFPLSTPMPLVQFSCRSPRGCVVRLEEGHPVRLMEEFGNSDLLPTQPPRYTLRFPPQHAALIACGHWSSAVVPHIPGQARGGGSILIGDRLALMSLTCLLRLCCCSPRSWMGEHASASQIVCACLWASRTTMCQTGKP